MEYLIGQTDEAAIAKHIEKLLRGMCVAGELNIDVSHNTPIDETRRRYVFTGADVEEFMELIVKYHTDADSVSYEQETYYLVMCAATSRDSVHYQDDGTVAVVYDMEFCPDVESYRNCTEEDVVAEFECMIKEFGFSVNGKQDKVYTLDAAMQLDEIAVREWFANWVDNEISDGKLPEGAANYSC